MAATTSLWLANAGVATARPAATFSKFTKLAGAARPPHFDVVVVGGGIVGLQAAWNLKKEGKTVALLEARTVGGGTTGFSTAKLASLQGPIYSQVAKMHGPLTAKRYYEMNQGAIDKVERLDREFNLGCEFERRSHTVWTADANKLSAMRKEYETCSELNIPCDFLEAVDLNEELPPSVGALSGVRFKMQAQFNSYKYCMALAKLVDGGGCAVYENTRVASVSESAPHEVKLIAEDEALTGDFVILATHLPIMDRSMHFAFLEPSRSHCLAVKVKKKQLKNMFINADTPLRSLRTSRDDSVVVVCGEPVKMGDDARTEKYYEHLLTWAKEHLQVESVVARWSAMDYYSSDHIPFSGYLYEGTKSIFTATGFNKWGLTNGIASADLITDLIVGRENPYHAMMDARRWSLKKQALGFAQENWHVTKHFVGDKLKHLLAVDSIRDLKPGDGGVVKKGMHKVGVYVDDQGKAHCVKPVCTHLGCDLVFNQGDKAWDCPCHGSQFDVEGNVLHGPACKPLEKMEW